MSMVKLSSLKSNFVAQVVFCCMVFVVGLSIPDVSHADETVPILPCRILDTRNTSVGYVPNFYRLDFDVRGTPGAAQGGEANCGVPTAATGVFFSVAAITPSSNGHVTVWTYRETQPIVSTLNVTAAQTSNTGGFIKLAPIEKLHDLSLRGAILSAYYVIDITGYTVPSTATLVGQGVGTLFDHILVIETAEGRTVRAYVPDSLATFKSSWSSLIDNAVGKCVHVGGIWTDGNSPGEEGIFEARSLPITIDGYCGPESSAATYTASTYAADEPRLIQFQTFANAPFSPGALSAGDRFIIVNGVGEFSGHDREYATWNGGEWVFEKASEGDLAINLSTGVYYRYRESGIEEWREITMSASGI